MGGWEHWRVGAWDRAGWVHGVGLGGCMHGVGACMGLGLDHE